MKVAIATGNKLGPLARVDDIPKYKINADQILVKTVAVAVNPTDWKHNINFRLTGVLGSDASGIVEEVGSNVTGYVKGDVVTSFDHGNNDMTRGKFGEYFIANPSGTLNLTSETFRKETILKVGTNPSSKLDTFEAIASVPLSVATAGLSLVESLNVEKGSNKLILIWGGSTSAGIIAIQLARALFGLRVFTTASSKNAEFLKLLGAEEVFDYHAEDVVQQIKEKASGQIAYALDSVASDKSFQQTYDSTVGSNTEVIDNLNSLLPKTIVIDETRSVKFTRTIVYDAIGDFEFSEPRSASEREALVKRFSHFWNHDLPTVIDTLQTPKLLVLPPGLESVNIGLELLLQNKVSAEKIVFRV